MVLCLTGLLPWIVLLIACAPAPTDTDSSDDTAASGGLDLTRADCVAEVVVDLGGDGFYESGLRRSFGPDGRLMRVETDADGNGQYESVDEVTHVFREDGSLRLEEHTSPNRQIWHRDLRGGRTYTLDELSDGEPELVANILVDGLTELHVENELATGLVHWRTVDRDERGNKLIDIFDFAGDRTVDHITEYQRGPLRLERELYDTNADGVVDDVADYHWTCAD